MSALTSFNTQLYNLIDSLCKLFPHDSDLSLTKTSISFMKRSNPRKLQVLFNDYVSKFK